MKRLIPLFALMLAGTLMLNQSGAQESPTPGKSAAKGAKTVQTPAGAFTALGQNSRGYPEYRREKDGSVMVLVPGGQFFKWNYIGDPFQDATPFQLNVPSFLIDKYEMTNAKVAKFLKSQTQLKFKAGGEAGGKITGKVTQTVTDKSGKTTTRIVDRTFAASHKWGLEITKKGVATRKGYAQHPFVGGSGFLALAYARWAGADLPYGYEWEKAAAGPTGQTFPWGEQLPDSTLVNSWLQGPKHTMKIGSYAAGTSPYGLLDMAGNVYERAYWFETDKEIDPSVFPVMLKGGSWLTAHWANLRNVDRCAQPMAAAEGSVGFRTVIRDPATIKALGVSEKVALRVYDDYEAAFEEAAVRNVPIFLFLCYETCGQCDRVRAQVFTDEKFIAYMNEYAVLTVGHNFGDGAQDPVESVQESSTLFPGTQLQNLIEVWDNFVGAVSIKTIPEAIWDFKLSPGQFALNPHLDLHDEPDNMILVPESGFPKSGAGVEIYIARMKEAQKVLGQGQTRTDYIAGKPGPEITWEPPEED